MQEMFLAVSVALSQGQPQPRHTHVFGSVAFDTTYIGVRNEMYLEM